MNEIELVNGGPQDGVKVKVNDDVEIIYVGGRWLGKEFATWEIKPSTNYSHKYELQDGKFYYRGFIQV